MQRKHARLKRPVPLNLVSLIDIFTVLVFFLIVNFGDVTLLSEADNLELPLSVAEQKAKEGIVVVVSRDDVLVAGKSVAKVSDLAQSDQLIVPAIQEAIRQQIAIAPPPPTPPGASAPEPRRVTVLGDKGTPYSVLKKVMQSCSVEDVGKIALAVTPKGALGDLNLSP
jgi:biopolymer transport protein ExbD